MRKLPTLCILLAAAVTSVACSSGPDLVFADWLLPVPEGTPIMEYAPVPLEEREAGTIELIDDLVIGTDLSNPAAVLYEPRAVMAAPSGSIFVADAGTVDIKMFDADGNYVKTLGKEGQGPGEFGFISDVAIAGDTLVVEDSRNARFSIWTLDGEHVADHAPSERRSITYMSGLADGTLAGYFTERDEDRSGRRVVMHTNVQGEILARILEIELPAPTPVTTRDPRALLQDAINSFDNPRTLLTVGGGEVIYVTPSHEYQVFAYTTGGEMAWALRTAWERFEWPDSAKESLLASFTRSFETDDELRADEFTWPEKYYALLGVRTDGRGRMFTVISPVPNFDNDGSQPPTEYPLDAYSPDGELLAAGVVPYLWTSAQGDYVYGTRPDENDETVVVRYRLLVNGQ